METKSISGLVSPWDTLNEVVSFGPGQLVLVGAHAGVGRSMVVNRWAAHVAVEQGLPAVIFSSEAPAMVAVNQVESGGPEAVERLVVCDDDEMEVGHVRSRVAGMVAEGARPALVVAGDAQMMEGYASGATCRDLKHLAVEFGTCVVVPVALGRHARGRIPVLNDLQGTAAGESDVVILLHVEVDKMVGFRMEDAPLEAFVAKNRSGPSGARVELSR